MTIDQTIFEAQRATISQGCAKIRYGGDIIDEAFSGGLDKAHATTDQGNYIEIVGSVRYVFTDEPASWKAEIFNKVIEIKFDDQSDWQRCRVHSRKERGGIVSLELKAEFSIQ